MNIKERIAKLEKELEELKELYTKDEDAKEDSWTPRQGEIVEMSDDGECWILRRFDCETDFDYKDTFGGRWAMCRKLRDPMVIQMIPHNPGDEMPCDFDSDVIVLHGNEFSERYYTVDSAKNISWDMYDSENDVFGWAPLNED